jgi:ParB-like chromosome segregation protein Spo0J
MAPRVTPAFEPKLSVLPLSALVPLKQVPPATRATAKYRQIAASIGAVGIIEPLVVARSKELTDRFLLLDGHLRHAILLESGTADVRCLIATDDEAFTYNKRINRLATIQEHLMIVRAIERGVSEDRLAKALNLDVRGIRRRRNMLSGIGPDVVELLKDKSVNPDTFAILRRMRPMRQIEAAELMNTAGNYTSTYAKALLAATRQPDLVRSDKPKKIAGLTLEQMARMEREMELLQQDMKSVESRYGDDVLHLVIASGYLAKLVGNRAINRYLGQHHPELVTEFASIISAASIDQAGAS